MKTEQNKKQEQVYFCVQNAISGKVLRNDITPGFACVWATTFETKSYTVARNLDSKSALRMANELRELANVIEDKILKNVGAELFKKYKRQISEPRAEIQELEPLPLGEKGDK